MKAIAFYLPQFHSIPENDIWWGKGYTEWLAVKKAEKVYENQYQPHVPLNNNYYNLLDKKTMQWQADLMEKYNVYGMCFYHYYFKDGRKILEKPAENLLKWTDIKMPFCFSWANETWARTWSRLQTKNVWNSRIEEQNTGDDGILLKQEYGNEADWIKHFEYLLPFFKDPRYIKHDNSPIFIIHRAELIPCLPQMSEKWNELAKNHGWDGIYFIYSNSCRKGANAYLQQEVNFSVDTLGERTKYKEVCANIIENALIADDNTYLCGCPGYDDTPRRGTAGIMIEEASPELFYDLMKRLCYISKKRNREYIFINAWNEWGEGMHLEPDEKYKYGYLEALKKSIENCDNEDVMCEFNSVNSFEKKEINRLRNLISKQKSIINVLDKFTKATSVNAYIKNYFNQMGISSVAVYGLGFLGNHFIDELNKTDIKLKYGIDKSARNIKSTLDVFTLDDELPDVDAIVVLLPDIFPELYAQIRKNYSGMIISIEQVFESII